VAPSSCESGWPHDPAKNFAGWPHDPANRHGDEYGSAFEDFFVDGKEVKDLHATFAPGTTVLVELDSREQRDPYAIVLREGAKRVVLCAGQAKPWP
jgi:hypothetical protein